MKIKVGYYFKLVVVLFLVNVGWAQSNYQSVVEISEQASVSLTNYQVDLTINTQDLVTQGKLNADGSDLRFYSDSCLTTTLTHWVESGINTTSTLVWVLVPSIPANSVTKIYMGYGDPLAVNTSNFSATFPNATVSGGTPLNLTGNVIVDWFQLDAGDVLTLANGAPLSISARKIIINGTVTGTGAGYAGGASGSGAGQTGFGPGGGTPANPMNSGNGGGSYGGVGGTGGFDPGDSPGVGGAVYGTDSGTDFDMGSGGGASDLNTGGAGGGAFAMNAEYISIGGTIDMNGSSAQQPGGGRGAGGGAGGSVVSIGKDITFSGSISANGGSGSIGTSTANDDGGSGAGGRIKFLYTGTISNTGTTSVVGGPVGPNGTGGAPTVGGSGVVYAGGIVAVDDIVISINPEFAFDFTATLTGNSVACEGETITLSAGGSYGSYLWSTADSTSSIDVTVDGTYELIATAPFGCVTDTVDITVSFNPLPVLDLVVDTAFCESSSVILDAGAGFDSYSWSNGDTTQTTEIIAGGSYTISVTNIEGCSNDQTIIVTENPLPILSATSTDEMFGNDGAIDLTVTGGTPGFTYVWDNGAGTTQDPSGLSADDYTVIVTDSEGCSETMTITVDSQVGLTELTSAFTVFPNPTSGVFTIQPKQAFDVMHGTVYDNAGRVVQEIAFNGMQAINIDLSNSKSGVYSLVMQVNNETMNLRVIVQ